MAIALECPCGAHFEVEDTFAGHGVTCPECHRLVKAPVGGGETLRTSGYALASIILALVLAFTVVGTLVAVVLGVIGLVSIARNPGRVAGAGYAVSGILLGLIFTGLTVLAFSKAELFEEARERVVGNEVDRSGPLEVVRKEDGFAITRPSQQWGVARPEMVQRINSHSNLMLANPGRDAYLDVTLQRVGAATLDECRDNLVNNYKESKTDDWLGNQGGGSGLRRVTLRLTRRLPPADRLEREEVLLDIREVGQTFTFLIRLEKDDRTGRLYILRGWTSVRRYDRLEPDFRKCMDSFRLLGREEDL
jgi:hypothetical protein